MLYILCKAWYNIEGLFQYKNMIYTNKFINLISFIITFIIFSILIFISVKKPKIPTEKISNIISNIEIIKKDEDDNNEEKVDLGTWYIKIPSINLEAPIEEGTDLETLNTKVGHFEETSKNIGNIGLAAHNRGYDKNYFRNLKKVKMDDEVIYKCDNFEKRYLINKIEIIQNTDWSYLEKSDENKITLITCVENEPNLRRCVQAAEIEN